MSESCEHCKWWEKQSSLTGQCLRTAPVAGKDRVSMLGIISLSMNLGSGHIFTRRDHFCGDFEISELDRV